ncbi:NAD(P)H-dependent oxidoreductase [Schlesneria paludicola]|uniref:NAD(P)H-dependent oxidoreductase n=1 Tax=Schlesneria paludicola TaxID=360056 RepID=UPI00029A8002|nr:NAD(P)H-dependent oxidoreductase [Schlesneria paludicola]
MKPVPNDVVERQLAWRYATKMFDPAKIISDENWQTLEQTLVLTPSSFGLQPWKFVVITNHEVRAKLKLASWHQAQIVDASHLVVFAIRKNLSVTDIDAYIARIAEVRGTTVDSLAGFRKMLVGTMSKPPIDINEWAARQVYIAIGFFMATAALMGIDVCPIEGFEPEKYDQILDLTSQGYSACVVAAAGFRSDADKYANLPKVRFRTDDVIQRIS